MNLLINPQPTPGFGMASTSIPTSAWVLNEEITTGVLGVIRKYASTRVEVERDVDYSVTGEGHEWVEGVGATIEVVGEAPVEPVRDLLRNNGFRLIDTISNTIEEGDDYKEWEVGEKWEKIVHASNGVTILIQVDLVYEVDGRGVERLVNASVYPVMNT